jgi:hypothetical protein
MNQSPIWKSVVSFYLSVIIYDFTEWSWSIGISCRKHVHEPMHEILESIWFTPLFMETNQFVTIVSQIPYL